MKESNQTMPPQKNETLSPIIEGEPIRPLTLTKRRNRLSAKDKKAKREAVAADCRAGHPRRAIMLRHHLSKSQLNDFLSQLLMAGELTRLVPLYELALASTPIRSVLPFADDSVEYVHVEQTERGTLLTPYRNGDENELAR